MLIEVAILKRLPRRLDTLTYRLPNNLSARRGDLVTVPFRRGLVRGVIVGPTTRSPLTAGQRIRSVNSVLIKNFLPDDVLTSLEETAAELVQSLSSVLLAACPPRTRQKTPQPANSNNQSKLSVRRTEIDFLRQAAAAAAHPGLFFIQTTDLVQAIALTEIIRKSEPRILIFVPHHRDAFHLPAQTRQAALNIPSKIKKIIVLRSGSSEYVQYDRNPRYDAREIIKKIARQRRLPVIFTDVTPRCADLQDCQKIVELPANLTTRSKIIDLRQSPGRSLYLLTEELIEAISDTLREGKRVILSYNRKGRQRASECRDCGWMAKMEEAPESCPRCGGARLLARGLGNQIIEKELRRIFPKIGVQRIERGRPFSNSKDGSEIWLVTQYYFESVFQPLVEPAIGLLADLRADLGLQSPWYTATEQTARRLNELQGMAWRLQSPCLLQTWETEMIHQLTEKPITFLRQELKTRRLHHYPPSAPLYRVDGRLLRPSEVNLEKFKLLPDKVIVEKDPEKPLC